MPRGLYKRTSKRKRTKLACLKCGRRFWRANWLIRTYVFCSVKCCRDYQRKANPKKLNREYVKAYMRRYMKAHKSEHRRRSSEWSAANPARRARIRKRYNRLHRFKINELARVRRVRYKADQINEADWEYLKARFDQRCVKCRRRKKLEMDHVRAISKGGRHVISNIQPLCRSCNSSKGARCIDYRKAFLNG